MNRRGFLRTCALAPLAAAIPAATASSVGPGDLYLRTQLSRAVKEAMRREYQRIERLLDMMSAHEPKVAALVDVRRHEVAEIARQGDPS